MAIRPPRRLRSSRALASARRAGRPRLGPVSGCIKRPQLDVELVLSRVAVPDKLLGRDQKVLLAIFPLSRNGAGVG